MKYSVVMITTDQQRMDACGCYGNKIVRTPNIDKIAANGVAFTNAHCPSPLCAPSRASLITGRHLSHHGALTHLINRKDPGIPGNPGITYSETLGTMFRKAGYVTGAIGKMHVHGETRQEDIGFSVRAHRFYTYSYEDYINEVGQENVDKYLNGKGGNDALKYNYENKPTDLREELMQDSLTTKTSLKFISENKDKPFFIHIGLEKPHPAWTTQPRFHSIYNPSDMVVPATADYDWSNKPLEKILKGWGWRDQSRPNMQEIKNTVAAYYACVSEADSNVGKILQNLEDNKLMDKTIIVFASDHGDNLYEHGLMQKHCFYEASVKIPFIIAVPNGFPKNKKSAQPCSLIDFMPTLAELCGIPVPEDIDGVSLVPALKGIPDMERPVYSEYMEKGMKSRMVRKGEWKYIVYEEHNIEVLYNVKNDPMELSDVSKDASNSMILDELRALIDNLRKWQN